MVRLRPPILRDALTLASAGCRVEEGMACLELGFLCAACPFNKPDGTCCVGAFSSKRLARMVVAGPMVLVSLGLLTRGISTSETGPSNPTSLGMAGASRGLPLDCLLLGKVELPKAVGSVLLLASVEPLRERG